MSILMAALKQQTHPLSAQPAPGTFWRNLAITLALLLALLTGAVAAYWLAPVLPVKGQPAAAGKEAELTPAPVKVADSAAILQALQTAQSDKRSRVQSDLAVSETVVEAQQPQPVARPAAVTPKVEQLAAQPAIKTVTADVETVEAIDEPTPQPVTAAAELAEADISAELRDKFASALKATEQGSTAAPRKNSAPARDISELSASLQQQIPPLQFDAHVYATSAAQRWVKVNGKTLQEGQWITADIRIKEITPQYVLLQLGEQLFSIGALSNWPA